MYQVGLKALKRLVSTQDALTFHKAKLSLPVFTGDTEKAAFTFIKQHLEQHHVLPHPDTLTAAFPEMKEVEAPEPASYYLSKIDERFAYNAINDANIASQALLKQDQTQIEPALLELRSAINRITEQRYRYKLMDFAREGPKMVLDAYYTANTGKLTSAGFGWPYLDHTGGGVGGGEVASMVGRPSRGKTFFLFYVALYNWLEKNLNTLFVSMEMGPLLIAQRGAAMYAHTNLTQLKVGGYSTATYKLFREGMKKLQQEPGALYIVDGNLAACCEDIYTLAAQLDCKCVVVDGAYMVRHRNLRLDRYTRVAENMELMKRYTTELDVPSFATWQFSREAVKKQEKKKGDNKVGLEDIAYSDVIGQISSVVLGLFQEEGIETMRMRLIDVLKGRGGETGQFQVHWNFDVMDFQQVMKKSDEKPPDLVEAWM